MAGRSRKIVDISTGKIGKEKIRNRQEQEKKLKIDRESLIAPEWLSPNAKLEFERVVEEVSKINILDNLDLSVLAIYCNAYDGYIQTVEILNKEGLIQYKETSNGDALAIAHPAINTQEKYVKQIMQCSTKLGLATTDRLKLVVPIREEPAENKFITLLKVRKQG
jgi:hypothetical protein